MTAEEIREGDIVEIDYIEKFTRKHINEGKALVIWKGFNHQPLVRKMKTKTIVWTCYENIARVVGHIDIDYVKDVFENCDTCKYLSLEADDFPCDRCRHRYINQYVYDDKREVNANEDN